MAFLKPIGTALEKIWAANGDKTPAPDTAKINAGWFPEIPAKEFFNYIDNKQDAFIAHVNQLGVCEWDSESTYVANKSYVQGTNGRIYLAKTEHKGVNPTAEINASTPAGGTNWKLAFYYANEVYSNSESNSLFTTKSSNLNDLQDKNAARSNLSVYSRAESDNNYLKRAYNFSDILDTEAARINLYVYSRSQTDYLYPLKTNNLSDISNPSAAFNNIKQAANEGYTGTARIATDGEAISGVDNTTILTPRKLRLGFSASLGINGHISFPSWMSGLILQWGNNSVTGNGSGVVATLARTFPTICLQGVVSLGFPNTADTQAPKCVPSGTNLLLYNSDSSTQNLRWFAVGY